MGAILMKLTRRFNTDSKEIRWPLVVFISLLPLYFRMPSGLQLPLIGFFFCLFLVRKSFSGDSGTLKLVCFYLILGGLQIFFTSIFNYDAYVKKYMAIFICVGTYSLFLKYYNEQYDRYIYLSLVITIVYGVFSAPSHILGYQDYLIPGTCGDNNLSDIGHLRCATFGEGNYFGGYVAILMLIFSQKNKFMILCLIGTLIAWAPTPILIYGYIFYKKTLRKLLPNLRAAFLLNLFLMAFLVSIFFLYYQIILDVIVNASETSSLGERLEFIRSGFAMWIDHPMLGVGFGNYGFALPNYTVFPHLINQTLYDGIRYIPNNNIIEFLSEQGVVGFSFYIYLLMKVSKVHHPIFNRFEIFALIVFIGLAMPTFFQLIVAALLGIFQAKFQITPPAFPKVDAN